MVCKKKHFDLKNEICAYKNLHNDTDCRTIATRTIPIHNSHPFLLDKNKENQSRYLCYRIKMGGNCGWELSGWQLSGPLPKYKFKHFHWIIFAFLQSLGETCEIRLLQGPLSDTVICAISFFFKVSNVQIIYKKYIELNLWDVFIKTSEIFGN